MKIGKIWGITEPAMISPGMEIHRLSIKPEAWCSRHRHAHKANAFLVVEGILYVTIQREWGDDVTILSAGEMTTVEPGLFHHFRTGPEGCECFEVYYPAALSADDIERVGVGGSVEATVEQDVDWSE